MEQNLQTCIIDDHDHADNISLLLKSEFPGFEISFKTNNILQAFEFLSRKPSDLIFLNSKLTDDYTGDLLIRHYENSQIILITDSEKSVIEAIKKGVTNYLLRPVKKLDFVKAVNRASENFRKNKITAITNAFQSKINLPTLQGFKRVNIDEIIRLRGMLLEQKTELALEKDDVESLKAYQESQKRNVAATQSEKNELLTVTKGKESEYQKIVEEKQATAAEIRKRIFRLLGGGELSFEEAYQYAKLAEAATGVRSALTLAILDRESLFGKNVGRCSYTTAMHPTRDMPYFLALLGRLGLDPNSEFVKVSCPIAQHGSYGGAMGPAQFIPSTWKLYESKIAAVTGNNPPNPWNNADAFAATAVYMKDLLDSSSCKSYAEANKNVVSYQTLLERCAAAKYYSGSRWYTYRFWYGDPVVQKANEFEQDIKILNS